MSGLGTDPVYYDDIKFINQLHIFLLEVNSFNF